MNLGFINVDIIKENKKKMGRFSRRFDPGPLVCEASRLTPA